MDTTTEILTPAAICSSESITLQRLYELIAEVLRSIAAAEEQQAEAA